MVRKKFTCNKNTSLEELLELIRGLEVLEEAAVSAFASHLQNFLVYFIDLGDLIFIQRERENIMKNKRQVQHLVANSKNIVRLKPRNPEEKSSSPVIVKALCDFIQDQVGLSLRDSCYTNHRGCFTVITIIYQVCIINHNYIILLK